MYNIITLVQKCSAFEKRALSRAKRRPAGTGRLDLICEIHNFLHSAYSDQHNKLPQRWCGYQTIITRLVIIGLPEMLLFLHVSVRLTEVSSSSIRAMMDMCCSTGYWYTIDKVSLFKSQLAL